MNTSETELVKVTRRAGDFHIEAPVIHISDVRVLLTSRDTYWKERVDNIGLTRLIENELLQYVDGNSHPRYKIDHDAYKLGCKIKEHLLDNLK